MHRVLLHLRCDRRRFLSPADRPVPIELKRGQCSFHHPLLVHGSYENRSDRPRHAYALHLIDGCAEYAADNWLQRPDLPMRGFA